MQYTFINAQQINNSRMAEDEFSSRWEMRVLLSLKDWRITIDASFGSTTDLFVEVYQNWLLQ